MSIRVMSWVFDHAPDDLKPSEMLTLLVLADHANEDGGLSYPSVRTLSRKTRLGERTVQAALKVLMERSLVRLQMKANGPRPDVYCFPIFRGAGFAGVTDRMAEPTPAKNDTLPPQIFPKNNSTPIKENRPIEPSITTDEVSSVEQPFQMWEAFCEETGQDYKLATTKAKGYALKTCQRLIADNVTIDQVRRYVQYRLSQTWRSEVVVTMSDVEKGIGEWRMAHAPSEERPPAPKPTSNGRAPYNDEKRPIPSGMPDYLNQPAKRISPDKLSELRAMRGKS